MIVLVGLAGGLGALLRWAASGRDEDPTRRALKTAIVNLVGSLALGVLVGLFRSARVTEDFVAVAGVGLLGGFTTFSTWKAQVVERAKSVTAVVAWTGPVLMAGLGLAWLGIILAGGFG